MSKSARFRQDRLPKQSGEIARLRVRKGADVGTTYVLFQLPAAIGRGEENEVVIADLKASRKHATITREPKGRWFIQDNGSANGILYKDKAERQFLIQHQSIFSIGETEFEFLFADLLPELQAKGGGKGLAVVGKSSSLGVPYAAPVNPLTGLPMTVGASVGAGGAIQGAIQGAKQGGIQAGIAAPRPAAASRPQNYTSGSGDDAAAKKKRNLIFAVVAVGGVLFLMNEEVTKNKAKKPKVEPKRDLASLLPQDSEGGKVDMAESIFKAGFREYREKNYLRSKTLFETVLQVSPGHILAEKYLAEAESSIKEDILYHLKKGRQELNTGRLKSARGHYESVTRLLYRTPTDPHAIEARDQLNVIRSKIRGGSTS